MLKFKYLIVILLAFKILKAQAQPYCIQNGVTQNISIPNPISINPAPGSGNTLNPTINNGAIQVNTAGTNTGVVENYIVNTQNGGIIEIQLNNPPLLDPLIYDLNCIPNTLTIAPTNLATGAIVQLQNPPAGLTVNANTGVVTLPSGGITNFSAVQVVENFNGMTGCSSVSTRAAEKAIISLNYQFQVKTPVELCASAEFLANSLLNNYTLNNLTAISINSVAINPANINTTQLTAPAPAPSNGQPTQIETVSWPVSLTYNGCTFTQNTHLQVTQMNTNLAKNLIVDQILGSGDNDLLVLALPAGTTANIVGDLSIPNANPDTNPGFSMAFSTTSALTAPYNISLLPEGAPELDNVVNAAFGAISVPMATVFANSPKTLVLRNTLQGGAGVVPPVCVATPLFADINISFDKPTVSQLQIQSVNPNFQSDFPCSGDSLSLTLNNPCTTCTYELLDDGSSSFALDKTSATIFTLAQMPTPNPTSVGGRIQLLAAKSTNELRSSNQVYYQSINNFDGNIIQYDNKIICGWPADPNESYQYDPSTNGLIPINPNPNLQNPTAFAQGTFLGVSYATTDANFGFIGGGPATSSPQAIFYDSARPTPLNPADWIEVTGTNDLGSVLYLPTLQTEANYGRIEFKDTKKAQFYWDETIAIPSGTVVPPTGIDNNTYTIPNDLSITCSLPKTPTGQAAREVYSRDFYYGSRRLPEPPRIELGTPQLILCPGLTSTLNTILTQNTTYATSSTDPSYRYQRNTDFSISLKEGFTEPTLNSPTGQQFDASTGLDPQNPSQPAFYNEDKLKVKYTYNYELTDSANQCTAEQSFTIAVDQACLDAMISAKNPINSCTGEMAITDMLNFSNQGLNIAASTSVLQSVNFPAIVGTTVPKPEFQQVAFQLPLNTTTDLNFPIVLSVLDNTDVTYEFDVTVTTLQQEFGDFSYSPNVLNVNNFFPNVLEPQFDPLQFTPGGVFTAGNISSNVLNAGNGFINVQNWFDELQITNNNQLNPYVITYTTPNQCVNATAEITLEVPLLVYNGISPNGDGKNEVLWIDNVKFYPNLVFEVFDANGNRVFYQKGYNNTWNGVWTTPGRYGFNISGQLLKPGTYYYNILRGKGFPVEKGLLFIRY